MQTIKHTYLSSMGCKIVTSRTMYSCGLSSFWKYYNSCGTKMHLVVYAQFSTWQRFEVLSWKGFEHSTNLISFFLVWMKMFFFTYLSSLSSNDMLPSFGSSLFWITFLLKLNIRKFQLVNSPAYCLWGGSSPGAGTGKPRAQYSCPLDSTAFAS